MQPGCSSLLAIYVVRECLDMTWFIGHRQARVVDTVLKRQPAPPPRACLPAVQVQIKILLRS